MNILKYPNVNWSLPILFSNDEYILAISSIMKRLELKNPITYAYGMVPSAWTGGRLSRKLTQDKSLIEKQLNLILETGTIPTFTFTCYDINSETLEDEFCNWLLDFGVENNCHFILTSDMLYDYIKEKHPEAKCVASVLKAIYELDLVTETETEYYNNLLNKYDRVVVRPEYAKETLLKEYSQIKDISRLEVLVNQICIPNCPHAIKEHLAIPNIDMDRYKKQDNNIEYPECIREKMKSENLDSILTTPTLMFTEEEIVNLIDNIGIKNLKLQGRNYSTLVNTRIMNNYVFEEIGEFQNISPIIWGTCSAILNKGVLPL